MTRTMIIADIAALQDRLARDPGHAFSASRRERLVKLQAQLAALPVEAATPSEDPGLVRMMELQLKAERAQRATERRGY